MYTIDKLAKHIEHLGFHVLMKVDRNNESTIMVEDSISFVANISKIRKYLNSNFNYDLSWKTNCVHYNENECNLIVLTILKKEKQQIAA